MPQLHIDLQEGFRDGTVIIKANGHEVFNKHNVQTKLLLGYANTFEVEVPGGMSRVEVVLPTKKLAQTFELTVTKNTYLGISLKGDQIEHYISKAPFGYG